MTFKEAFNNLTEKFTSGNNVPVTRSTITKEEFEAIRDEIIIGSYLTY
jgi:hypothetical protein